jgi:hypothetical protein
MNLSEMLVDSDKVENGIWEAVNNFAGEDIEILIAPLYMTDDKKSIIEASAFIAKYDNGFDVAKIQDYIYASSIRGWKNLTWDGTTPCDYSFDLCYDFFTKSKWSFLKKAFKPVVDRVQHKFKEENSESVISNIMATHIKKK